MHIFRVPAKNVFLAKQKRAHLLNEMGELKNYLTLVGQKLRGVKAREPQDSAGGDARDEYDFVHRRLSEISYILRNSQTITRTHKSSRVRLGSRVEVRFRRNGKCQIYQLVGSLEADSFNRKVSNESLFGRGLLGKKVGDLALIDTPTNQAICEVVGIV